MAGHGLQRYDYANPPTQGDRVNRQTVANGLRRIIDAARANGITDAEIAGYMPDVVNGNGACAVPGRGTTIVTGQKLQDALQQQGAPWGVECESEKQGPCPTDLDRYLAWVMRASCTYNQFGCTSSSPLTTNTITVPDPGGSFNVAPGNALLGGNSLGIPFPDEWSGEGAYHGIWRVKVSLEVRPIQLTNFTIEELTQLLFETFTFRVIQFGTDDPFTTAVNFGEVADAQGSIFVPSAGGFFFPEGNEFVPWIYDPSQQAYDFSGTLPGVQGQDQYTVTARVCSYWRSIV
jgi:hypothetical protein